MLHAGSLTVASKGCSMHHQEPDRGFADLQVCEECSGVRIVKDDSGVYQRPWIVSCATTKVYIFFFKVCEECSGVRIVKDDSGVYQRPWFVRCSTTQVYIFFLQGL
ncbi:hypothetical protein EJB05_50998 [Eragrostis curvula]|uniref:Uncharacterized protein n=1 Tax=Eragrostis curvula TaxID=38414 RepID=A0A5J9SWU4_9POAL|nr:hypothetical protein EJB05_50998 [Eragrostis curvula]